MPITEEIYQVLVLRKTRARGSINVIRSRPQGRAESPLSRKELNDPTRTERLVVFARSECFMPCKNWKSSEEYCAEARALAIRAYAGWASFYHATLLATKIRSALFRMLANKLASPIMPAIAIREVVEQLAPPTRK